MDRDILRKDVSARKGLIAVSTGVIANEERLLTVADLSAMLQVRPSTIYSWTSIGYVPVVKLGSAVRFSRPAIEAWLRSKSRSGRARRRLEIEIEKPSKRTSTQVEKSARRQRRMKKTGERHPLSAHSSSPKASHE